jgi:hypothetical protein
MRDRPMQVGGIVVVLTATLAAACASRAAPSARDSSSPPRTVTASPSGPVTAGPITTASPGVEPTPPVPTAPVGCYDVDVTLSPDWQQPVAYVCLRHRARLLLHLPGYPGGWSPPKLDPAGSAGIHTSAAGSDGSQEATVNPAQPGSFTIRTSTLDNLAATYEWTIHVVVQP